MWRGKSYNWSFIGCERCFKRKWWSYRIFGIMISHLLCGWLDLPIRMKSFDVWGWIGQICFSFWLLPASLRVTALSPLGRACSHFSHWFAWTLEAVTSSVQGTVWTFPPFPQSWSSSILPPTSRSRQRSALLKSYQTAKKAENYWERPVISPLLDWFSAIFQVW